MSCLSSAGTPGPLSAISIRARPERVRPKLSQTCGAPMALRRLAGVADQVDQHLAHQVRIGVERRQPIHREREHDPLHPVAGAEQALRCPAPGVHVDRPAADLGARLIWR